MLYLLRRLRVLRYAALRSGADDLPLPAPNVSRRLFLPRIATRCQPLGTREAREPDGAEGRGRGKWSAFI